jgi:demethylmenaquinone methyltransferase/2-methoxy-6-polyprenyl-1,4-benzoquinol methylase
MTANPPSDPAGSASPAYTSPTKRQALELFRGLPRRYDRLSAALSFYQDPRWRRALVDALAPAAGERILDVATGTGMVAAELLARADCTVVGLDQSAEMLAGARARFAAGPEGARVQLIEG